MGTKKTEVTKQEVAEACRELRRRGEAVSRRSVLAELKKGSMTTINRLMQQIEYENEPLIENIKITKAAKKAAKILIQAGEKTEGLQKECADLRKLLADVNKELGEMRDKNQALVAENRELKGKVARLAHKLQQAEKSEVHEGLRLF